MDDSTRKPAENDSGLGLHEAIRTLTSELSLELVLRKVADLSRRLASAEYSSLGIVAKDGTLARFITSGLSEAAAKRIGDPPSGKGVLGLVLREGRSLRLADLSQHPESSGFPPNHPEMHSFLGVPITYKGRVLGDLYLTTRSVPMNFPRMTKTSLPFSPHKLPSLSRTPVSSKRKRGARLNWTF